jgi:hypothetical protein
MGRVSGAREKRVAGVRPRLSDPIHTSKTTFSLSAVKYLV